MTNQQKIIIAKLFEGGSIASSGPGQIRLRDPQGSPILKVSVSTFYWLSRNLLREKKDVYVLNKTKMRGFHGNSYVKKLYLGKAKAPQIVSLKKTIAPDRPAKGLTLF